MGLFGGSTPAAPPPPPPPMVADPTQDIAAAQRAAAASGVQEPSAEGAAPDNFARNKEWIAPGEHTYETKLTPAEHAEFSQWVKKNDVRYADGEEGRDYDMKGFWKALKAGDPKAESAIDPNDQRMHYPDYWKTPYHETFSAESQWADPKKAPVWNDKDQLVTRDGKVLYDDRAANKK